LAIVHGKELLHHGEPVRGDHLVIFMFLVPHAQEGIGGVLMLVAFEFLYELRDVVWL
jgi:hypothetical protein